MKLNHECVRDLMLYIEENVPYGSYVYVNDLGLKQYSQEDIIYTADKLLEANYVDSYRYKGMQDTYPTIKIYSITWDGHNFLDNIRDDNVWSKIKHKVSSSVSSASLQIMSQIGTQVISGMLLGQ